MKVFVSWGHFPAIGNLKLKVLRSQRMEIQFSYMGYCE